MPWGVGSYNSNPNLNTNVNGIDISEGSAASGYDDALRQIMADIAGWVATGLSTLGGLSATYQDIPVTPMVAAFSFALAHRAGGIRYGGPAAAGTIPPHSSVAWPVGSTILVRNAGSGILTVTRGAGVTLSVNGGTASADGSMAIGSVASLVNWGVDEWTLTGVGVS